MSASAFLDTIILDAYFTCGQPFEATFQLDVLNIMVVLECTFVDDLYEPLATVIVRGHPALEADTAVQVKCRVTPLATLFLAAGFERVDAVVGASGFEHASWFVQCNNFRCFTCNT